MVASGSAAAVAAPAEPGGAAGWDAALGRWPRAHLLQSFGWGVLQATVGWEPRRLWVPVGDGRTLPLTALVGGSPFLLPPRVYVPKGPACAPDDAAAWTAVRRAVEALASEVRAAAVVVEPPAWAEETAAVASQLPGWEPHPPTQPRHTAVVDLDGGVEAILARMHPKGRYNTRLAARRGVVVVTEGDPLRASEVLGRLCAATAERQGIHQPDAGHLLRTLAAVPTAKVHLALVDGEAVAGALVASFVGEAIYLYGGSSGRHRERQPSALLHLEAMRAALAAGCRRYDLWGIPPDDDPRHPWHGLRRFKLSLGGRPRTTAGAWVRVLRPRAWALLQAAEGGREAVRRARREVRGWGRAPLRRGIQSLAAEGREHRGP